MKDAVTEDIRKLAKFNNSIIDANVTVDHQNSVFKAEISLQLSGSVITATSKDYNVMKAVNAAVDKTRIQVKKLKSKITDHRAPMPEPIVEPEEEFDAEIEE